MNISELKQMSIKEFRESGYLQEVNRQFLHPLGLALMVIIDDDGKERLGAILDYRDDLDGIIYLDGEISPHKAANVIAEQQLRAGIREGSLGYVVQPVNV